MRSSSLLIAGAGLLALTAVGRADPGYASHPPPRPLPQASTRALGTGPARYVDPGAGDDAAAGTLAAPWKTVQHGVEHLAPGDTLYLHGGTYFETVKLTASGTARAPITIRAVPNELAILDGGFAEFEASPATAWVPAPGGAPDEYQAAAPHEVAPESADGRHVWVIGNFADSMIPLHGYQYDADFRSDNPYWTVENSKAGTGIYVGPGVWYDWKTHLIHVRLAHTHVKSQGVDNYTGERDPRKLALVIGTDHTALSIANVKHVRIQDLVVRGSAKHTVEIDAASDIELDGMTIYGGSPALFIRSADHLRVVRSTLRGLAAPWSSRASMKYRGNSPYLLWVDHQQPQTHDVELANDEFTDGHDGLVLDTVKTLRFHHNRLDNFNDDGLYLTLAPRPVVPDDIQIYENYFTRMYTTLAFAEDKKDLHNPVGAGVFIYRNIFDLRGGTYGWIPKDAATDDKPLALLPSRLCGDHGSPVWEPLFFYHNTVLTADTSWRSYYGDLLGVMGTDKGTKRRVFDNLFVQLAGVPGLSFAQTRPDDDIQVDGNLFWSVSNGTAHADTFFDKLRASPAFEASKKVYTPGWATHDVYGDPLLADLAHNDVRLNAHSAAIDAGIAIPAAWPDSLRASDAGRPDIGALPVGAALLRVGPASTSP